MEVPSSAPLYFPADPITTLRGSCGKKNCAATIAEVPGSVAGPGLMHFGGSGRPDVAAETAVAGAEIPWLYNNMLGQLPEAGWFTMQLNPDRPSTSRLAEIDLLDQRVLSVESLDLFFRVSLPAAAVEIDAAEPLSLSLVPSESSSQLMMFESTAPWELAVGGTTLLRVERCQVSVTGQQHLSFEEVDRSGGQVSFRVRKQVEDIDGPVVWFVHDPESPAGQMPLGELDFDGDLSPPISVDLESLEDAPHLCIEAVSIRDERHLWALAEVSRPA